jgi:hypothetical protein
MVTASGPQSGRGLTDACSTKFLRRIRLAQATVADGTLLDVSAVAVDPWTGREVELRLYWAGARGQPVQWVAVGRHNAPARHLMRNLPYLLTGLGRGALDEAMDWLDALHMVHVQADLAYRSMLASAGQHSEVELFSAREHVLAALNGMAGAPEYGQESA